MDIRKLQRAIVDGLEDAKAQDIAVFNTEHLSPLFERVIIATGASNRQTKALASRVREAVRAAGFTIMRTEGSDNGEWIIVDCAAAVVHIMQPAIRQYYQLEEIWGGKPVSIKLKAEKVGLVKASEPMDDDDAPAAKSARKPAAKKAAAGKVAAKKAPARKSAGTATKTATKTPTKAAPKPAAKPASGPKTPARKIALKSAGTAVAPKAPAKKAAAKKAPAKVTKLVVNAPKPAAKKVAAKKAAVRAAAPKPVIKKVAGKKAAVKKVAAKKAAPRSRG